ncbi:uncharacterized protein ACO6RY_18437 [Pungitius sinensis]
MLALHKLLLLHLLASIGLIADGSEIIDGEIAPENSMPYMVSVQTWLGHNCGGVLVHDDFVLTAAHCEEPHLPLKWVVVGTNNLKENKGQVIQIKKKYMHPSYENVGSGNDIMLLKLSSKVNLDNEVQTIPLATAETNVPQSCQVAGWGRTESKMTSDDLRVVNVSIIDPEACRRVWPIPLPNDVICAGGYETTKGFCQGDSGGPLVCDGKVVGLVSFNHDKICKYPDQPNVYTDVSKYLAWIEVTIKHG